LRGRGDVSTVPAARSHAYVLDWNFVVTVLNEYAAGPAHLSEPDYLPRTNKESKYGRDGCPLAPGRSAFKKLLGVDKSAVINLLAS
jgi:hypothetical protein